MLLNHTGEFLCLRCLRHDRARVPVPGHLCPHERCTCERCNPVERTMSVTEYFQFVTRDQRGQLYQYRTTRTRRFRKRGGRTFVSSSPTPQQPKQEEQCTSNSVVIENRIKDKARKDIDLLHLMYPDMSYDSIVKAYITCRMDFFKAVLFLIYRKSEGEKESAHPKQVLDLVNCHRSYCIENECNCWFKSHFNGPEEEMSGMEEAGKKHHSITSITPEESQILDFIFSI